MGIKGLNKLISDNASLAIRQSEMKNFFGRKVAIDASMSLYQFLIAVRQQDGGQLTNENGDTTSHLMGMFYRTLRMVDNGIKPLYVFDGKPPVMKGGELAKRLERRETAEKAIAELKETGTVEEISKFERRTVRVTKEQNEDAKKLLKLMGIPYVEAPCEAEAQCAALAKAGKVYAAASEDMDTLCYKTPFLLRHLTFSEARKMPISEISYDKIIEGLELTHAQFIDLCILMGCDYCDTIRGVGPVTAYKLIKEHETLENIVQAIERDPKSKYQVPENWPYKEARLLFLEPEVADPDTLDIKWQEPDIEGLVEYLVKDNGFAEDRIRAGAERLKKQTKTATQGRLDGFFKVLPKTPEQLAAAKRKNTKATDDKKKTKKAKFGKK
ncbi:flap endonuclease 1 [Nadsonia fulvescens var. elongata DSM 6958]|uniref:Flap endonuclease 1 n=1 Tax=Nadsonia fulvescens var. elongata DSM 6958 TaxID=857566 RepID=A0A1E3PSX6_9ASCO|nr:flap endonuclease 1 [Nadsonia fulvescens var. elongata DSM 6958]